MLLNHSATPSLPTRNLVQPHELKILAVDDRKENLLAIEATLKGSDYHIYYALNGHDAIDLVSKHDFAVILLDVQMPGIDGFETARLIRQKSENVPIIFVTAIHRDEEFETRGYIAGAVDYLFKPINPQILISKVSVFCALKKQSYELAKQAEILKQSALRDQENRMLKDTLAARDEFLSIASHELKTPMTPLNLQIQTFIKLFEEDEIQSSKKEILQRLLQTSNSQVQRLTRLVNDLVDVARIRSEKLELQRESMNLYEVVTAVVHSFSEEIEKRKCEVTIDGEKDIVGFWDRFRLEQVFINLLTNALKYGDCKPIRTAIHKTDSSAVFEITDQGIGIAQEDQDRIFGRFERAVSPRSYGGLGLGLFISQEIINLHNGNIEVRSEPAKGSTFRVTLPLSHLSTH